MWNDVINLFREYMGTGLIVIWFLASLLYLFLMEKRKPMRIMFVYVPVILLLLFFNPLFSRLVYGVVGNEIYYRILWLLPIAVVIAYAAIDVWGRLEGVRKRIFIVAAAGLLMLSGSLIYSNPFFKRAENVYHVPQCVVDICDAIEVKGREVKGVFPAELLQYVRQYSPVVCMPYGREILVSTWIHHSELYDVMEAEEIDVDRLVPLARQNGCVYIILPEEKPLKGNLEQFDFALFDRMHGYTIYKDSTVNLTYFLEQ